MEVKKIDQKSFDIFMKITDREKKFMRLLIDFESNVLEFFLSYEKYQLK